MKPRFRYIFLLLFAFSGAFLTGISQAQVTAKFTVSSKSGCTPLFVSFTNKSTGTGTLTYKWDFGNGNTSTLLNPSQTYNTCGDYVVTLTVSNGSKTATDTAHITVFCKPTASFTDNNSSGCPGTCVDFVSTSTAGSGKITSTFWDFGDGYTSTLTKPTHCYTSAGNFNVTITITNSDGCSASTVIANAITIFKPPVASFTGTPTSSCFPPAVVNFTNHSTGKANLSYAWNFGDPGSGGANTSTLTSPNHTYNSPGTYTVTLIVTDGDGCVDTIIQKNYISVVNNTAGMTVLPSKSGCCPFVVLFGATSTGSPISYNWNFGGGIPSSPQQSPLITFPCPAGGVPVVYHVTLTETFFGGCVATDTATITVTNKPVANFTSPSTLSTCIVPNIVTFTNTSTAGAGAKYMWYFGDGDTSSAANPSHAYIACGPYNVRLIATNQYGCSDTITKNAFVTIICPTPSFTATPDDGCVPKTVSFNSTASTGNPIQWSWNFGDPSSGAANTSTLQNPTHIYTKPGCYNVKLIITNAMGCIDSVLVKQAVCIDNPPTPNFTATPTTTCAFAPVNFKTLSTGTDSLTTYLWRFGDGSTSTSPNPSHNYTDTGLFSITLIVCNAGCCDSIKFVNYIHILPPVANIAVIINCKNPYDVCFDGTKSLGASTYLWNFADPGSGGLNTSTSVAPCHLYSKSGDYTVSLTVTNSVTGCSFTQTAVVHVRKVTPSFTFSPTSGCIPVTVNTVNNSTDANSYEWIVKDSVSKAVVFTSIAVAPTFTFTANSVYTIELIAIDINGCADTLVSPVLIHAFGIKVNYLNAPTTGCAPLNVQFTDISVSVGNSIVSWVWNFGDNYCAPANNKSTLQNPTHTYTKPGCYTIELTATDAYGCTGLIAKSNVCISTPTTNFSTTDSSSCIGNSVCFTSSPNGAGYTYLWNFGDPGSGANNTSALAAPCHVYSATGQYTVSLKIIAPSGCDSILTKTNYINITKPVANFGASSPTTSICPPLLVNFVDSSKANIKSWQWDFGDGNTSTAQNPSHIYSIPGTYTVTLIVTNAGGCTDTLVKVNYIVVSGPNGTFTFTPSQGCAPLDVCFKGNAPSNLTFIWNYGNTTSGPITNSDSICYFYNVPGIYHPSLILQDSLGCTFAINSPDSVQVDGAEAKFAIIDNPKCSPGVVAFTDSSFSFSGITLWTWNFGDAGSGNADSSHLQNPMHNYGAVGKYAVTLTVKTKDGCSATYTDTLNVVPAPIAQINVIHNPICPGGTISFDDSSSSVIPIAARSWNFGDPGSGKLNTDTALKTSHLYSKPGTYTVKLIVFNKLGCVDSITTTVTVNPIPNVTVSPNAKICEGASTTLNAGGGIDYVWTPTKNLSNDSISNPIASPTTTTTYTVMVTDANGCKNKDSLIVTVNSLPNANAGPDKNICLGSPTTLRATGGVSYSWSPATGLSSVNVYNPVANPTTTTTYYVTITGANGCGNKDSVIVKVNPLPNASAGSNQSVCAGTSATLQGSGGVGYSWSSNPAGFTSNSMSVVVTPTVTTQYLLSVTDNNGCTADTSATVVVNPLPAIGLANKVILCNGASTQLLASGGGTYQWSPITGLDNPFIANPIATPADTTTYYVTVTNNFGCQATDSVTVDVLFAFTAQVKAEDTICAGSSVQLDASGGIIYSWSPASGLSSASISDPVASPTTTTLYQVTVSDGSCFSDVQNVLVYVLPDPAFDAGMSQTISVGQPVVLGQSSPTFTGSFSWSPDKWLSCYNCQNPIAKPDSTITYNVTFTNTDGCKTTDSVTLTILCPSDVIFIPDAFTPNGDGVDDVFYVRTVGIQTLNYFRVFDRWGQLVFETNDLNVGWDGTFNGKKLPPSVYVYDVSAVCSTGVPILKKGNVTLIR